MSKNSLYLMNFNNHAILSHQYYSIYNEFYYTQKRVIIEPKYYSICLLLANKTIVHYNLITKLVFLEVVTLL